jgi:hypothetical protein
MILTKQDLIAHTTEGFLPDSSLYELLHKRNVNILVASDGGHVDVYGSFGWVIGTQAEIIWDCQGTARGYPMQSYRAEGYGRMSVLLFLTHYIHYHGIQPAEDLRVTSYCDNSIVTLFGRIGVQLHTHLQKTAQTIPAHVPDRRHNNEWKRHTPTLPSC